MSQYLAVFELSSLDGANGFQINGEAANDYSGCSVSSAGDVNGDGFDDLIIGARYADPNGLTSGASYVVFGMASGFGATLALSSLTGTTGFQINGEAAGDLSGRSVSSAGDINGDGFGDVIVGAYGADPNGSNSGASYVVFGKSSGFGATLELSSLDGNNGFQINGEATLDNSGWSVHSAGDVNGDGFRDLIVSAVFADPNGSGSGASYVVFGKYSFGATLELSSLDGDNGFQINGEAASDQSGFSVSSAGDVNGDGIGDLLVGANLADPNGSASGASYVVFGSVSGFGANLNLSTLDGANGFQINGEGANDKSGGSVAAAEDVNGDGIDDLIVGAYGVDSNGSNSGASYVVFGKASGFSANLNLSTLNGTNGFQINGEAVDDASGGSVGSAGDFNGDGFADLLIGAIGGGDTGASYVVFGRAAGFAPTLELSSLDGNNGFRIDGEVVGDRVGDSVSSAGDVNGDGFADLVVGARYADPNGASSGASYVIFGSMPGEAVFRVGTAIANTIHGGNFDDSLFGLGGDDVLSGHDGDDVIHTADGDDTVDAGGGDDDITLGSGGDSVDAGAGDDEAGGGSGNNSFYGGSGDDVLYGRSGDDGVYGGGDDDKLYGNSGDDLMDGDAGSDVLEGGSGNDTLGGSFDGDSLNGGSGNDTLNGDDGNDVIAGGDGTDALTGGNGDDRLTGGDGKDSLNGGAGVDRFIYETAADSTSVNYDDVKNADFAADKWDVAGNITAIDATVASGQLATNGFDTKLAAAVGAAQLGANHAVLFTPTSGSLSGKTFLVVDQNGLAGYQASVDLVIELKTPVNLANIDSGDFI